MKNLLTIFFLLLFCTTAILAQQDAQFSQNMFNHLAINPAAAGITKKMCVKTLCRTQWVGFEGAPKTGLISADGWFAKVGGLGLTVVSDRIGFEKNFEAKLAWSAQFDVGVGILAGGLEGGIIQKSLTGNWLAPTSTTGDVAIPAPSLSSSTYDAGAGVYFRNDQIYAGLSTSHIPESIIKQGTVKFRNEMHHYITAGYYHAINPRLVLNPSVFVKSDASSTQLDANVIALFNNTFWLGASYRLTDAVVALGGIRFGDWKFGYSFDLTTSDIRKYSSNTHEFLISYCIKRPEYRSSHSNVLWLW